MDSQTQRTPDDTILSPHHGNTDHDFVTGNSWQSASCNLCGRIASPAYEVTADLETMSLCGDCKLSLFEGHIIQGRTRHHRQPARRGRRTRHSSSESIEDLFSQQFTHMINMARQSLSPAPGYDNQPGDGDAASRSLQHASSRTTSSGSGRWRRALSDTESEDFDNIDSHYGENESNASFSQYRLFHADSDAISFGAYGGDSDASIDAHSFLDAEIFIQPGEGSDFGDDTNIDPMHAGVSQWNSDDQEEDEEDGEWEEAEAEEDTIELRAAATARVTSSLASPSESNGSTNRSQLFDSPDFEGLVRWRIRESWRVLPRNILAALQDSDFPTNIGNPGDYLDARGIEELLEHLAETDSTRRGAPPAAVSFVKNLPHVIINKEHVKSGLVCAICKDPLSIRTEANQLPCLHLYHPSCILPWLGTRNSCPLCRYVLPTDDKDYEESKRSISGGTEIHGIREQDESDDTDSDASDEGERDEAAEINIHRREQQDMQPSAVNSTRERGRGGWFFLAAAPVVSLVGIVIAVWLSNPQRRGLTSAHNTHLIDSQRGSRGRRWWPIF